MTEKEALDMMTYEVKHSPYGDTRTAPKNTTREQFCNANAQHAEDVNEVLTIIATELAYRGLIHDKTKFSREDIFWRDFQDTIQNGANFVDGDWYQNHIREERHHPMSYCHKDVDLIDILEMIVDCCCAAKTRSGSDAYPKINADILQKAYINTVEKVNGMIVLKEDYDE